MRFPGNDQDIVIIGGGICGLATALALHRVGLRSVVLERGNSLRTTGATIGIFTNGWRALDQLGVDPKLRQKAMPISGSRDISLDGRRIREVSFGKEEYRYVRRSELIETITEELPRATIHFGSRITAVDTDPVTSFPILHVNDGNVIKAKVVIDCDGVSSIIAEKLGLKPPRISQTCAIRGVTTYLDGHTYSYEFLRILENPLILGRIPIDSKSVYWYVGRPCRGSIAYK